MPGQGQRRLSTSKLGVERLEGGRQNIQTKREGQIGRISGWEDWTVPCWGGGLWRMRAEDMTPDLRANLSWSRRIKFRDILWEYALCPWAWPSVLRAQQGGDHRVGRWGQWLFSGIIQPSSKVWECVHVLKWMTHVPVMTLSMKGKLCLVTFIHFHSWVWNAIQIYIEKKNSLVWYQVHKFPHLICRK